jgi:hypothetical protein
VDKKSGSADVMKSWLKSGKKEEKVKNPEESEKKRKEKAEDGAEQNKKQRN